MADIFLIGLRPPVGGGGGGAAGRRSARAHSAQSLTFIMYVVLMEVAAFWWHLVRLVHLVHLMAFCGILAGNNKAGSRCYILGPTETEFANAQSVLAANLEHPTAVEAVWSGLLETIGPCLGTQCASSAKHAAPINKGGGLKHILHSTGIPRGT